MLYIDLNQNKKYFGYTEKLIMEKHGLLIQL